MSDQALLERIAGRDAHALADLYDRFAPVALALASRVLGDRSEAEDVLQTVFTRVWQEAGRYDASKGSVATWLLSWIRNASIDRLRRRDALHRATLHSVDRGAGSSHEEAPPDTSEDREKLARAVADLPADQRQVIELAYFDGLSQTQIAQKLGEPLGTVKTRIRLGMNKLRQALPVLSGEAH